MPRRRDDLFVGPKEKAIEAVNSGKKEEAIKYIEELYREFKPLHDRYADWIQFLLSFISEKLGEEAVEEALRGTALEIYRDRFASEFKTLGLEEIIKKYCQAHRSHYSDSYVEEDDEKFVIVTSYCGSGGRIQKGRAKGATKQAYTWSYGQEGVKYYCCHEAVFNAVFKELGFSAPEKEYCRQFDDEGRPTGGVCRTIVYKGK